MKATIRPYGSAMEMLQALMDHGLGLDPMQPVFVVQPLSGRAATDMQHLKDGGYHVHRNPKKRHKRPAMPTAMEDPGSLADAAVDVHQRAGIMIEKEQKETIE